VEPLETRTPKLKIMMRERGGGEGAAYWECKGSGWRK